MGEATISAQVTYLIPPQKLVTMPVLDTIPYVQKLSDAMAAYVL